MIKTQLKFIITIILVLGLSISLQSLLASWQAPTVSPPGGNIDRPINTGLGLQTKQGSLDIAGDLGIGSSSVIAGNLVVGGSINGDGAGIIGVNWNNIINKPIIQEDIIQSCSEGSSIREIKDDGTVVCEIDDGAATSFDNCFYDSDLICPVDTLMRGYTGGQAYCCGSTPASCTPTAWTNISGSSICVTGSACNLVGVCASKNGIVKIKQTRTLSDCLVEYQYVPTGANCDVVCASCATEYTCGNFNNLGNAYCAYAGGGSTPYLFTNIADNYYIENDVLATFWDIDYSRAKKLYEEAPLDGNGFADKKYRPTDKYILANNPDIIDNSIKLKIEEIEPEESHFDQIKLARVLYNKDAELIVDNQTNKLKSIKKELVKDALTECQFTNKKENKKECLNIIKDNDNNSVYGNKGDFIEFKIDIKDLKDKNVYLSMNSWGTTPLPLKPRVLEASSDISLSVFFDINNDGKYTELNQIHPRELETTAHLDITDIIEKANNNTVGVKILWTQEHWVDQIAIVTSEELEYRLEELAITKALHSSGENLLNKVIEKDQIYGSTKQGDTIDLEFIPGRYEMTNNEKEAYVFISSGFYNALQTELYPELKVDYDWQETVDGYTKDLNNIK